MTVAADAPYRRRPPRRSRYANDARYVRGYGRSGLSLDDQPIWPDDLCCPQDSVNSIHAECHHAGWGRHNCGHNEDAGVRCTTSDKRPPSLRRANANRGGNGIVLRLNEKIDAAAVETLTPIDEYFSVTADGGSVAKSGGFVKGLRGLPRGNEA